MRSTTALILSAVGFVGAAIALPAMTLGSHPQSESAGAARAAQKADFGVYIVWMIEDPALAYDGGIAGMAATKPRKGKKIDTRSAGFRKYRGFLEDRHDATLQAAGVDMRNKLHDYGVAFNGFAARLSAAEVAKISTQRGVLRVMADELRQKTTESSPSFLGLDAPGGAWAKGLNGEDVVIGVIDSGIWPEHPSFADDGSYGPPPVTLADTTSNPACNFGNTGQNPDDAAFTCNNKLIGARQMLTTYRAIIGADPDEYDSARDDDGHGTHTASTAAGNARVAASVYGIARGEITGIAHRARVIAYKGLGNLGGFGSDLAAAIDQAVADGVDVINYSIGGGASLIGPDDLAFLFAADAGVYVATSAGNTGPGPATIGGPGSVPWLTTVGASTQTRFFEGRIVLGDSSEFPGASITEGVGELPLVDAATAGGDLCVPGTLDANVVAGNIVLCRRGVVGRAAKSLAVFQAGGAGMILYNNVDTDNLFTDTHWVPSVHIDNTPGLAVKAYIAGASDPTARIDAEFLTEWTPAPSVAYFSSRGPDPVALDIIKPDVTAPGHMILAGNSPTPDPGVVPGQLFQAISGTSMSSPHVAGVFALIKQAHPDWSPAMAKSALMTTAYQDVIDNDRVSLADPFDMGAGHINPGGKANKGSLFEPGLAYDAGFLDYLGFLCDAAPEAFADPAGTCSFLESIGVLTDASDLNLASIGVAELPGAQTVVRRVTSVAKENGWRTYDVSMSPPPGYTVTVHPSSFRLKRGMSATYEVTMINQSAPIGEWRFGSLAWRDKTGHYDVYSPIAVRASSFNAPAEISGAGTSGTASFDVKFGYTGSYTADPHGLVADSVISGNVLQDPDQSFSPADCFSNAHTFDLSGAAVLRLAMTQSDTEAGADIDLYLFDPSNNFVASSTSGGTDELIDILSPADGTWTLFVHGWSTPGGDSDYDLHSWIVSATPGGSLSVDSAPGSATNGTTGTVIVSWTGLAAGTGYLGAVSHTGNGGPMGLTLVNVDTH